MRKTAVHVTHVEILCFAIRHLEREVKDLAKLYEEIPKCEPLMQSQILEREQKIDLLKEMYRFETGTDY